MRFRRLIVPSSDVVPVDPNTVEQWTHPPYSGYFDGTVIAVIGAILGLTHPLGQKLWGRGSSDDKSGLIGILSVFHLVHYTCFLT